MKKVILTGASGFIGSNLLNELTENGYFVYAVVRDIEKAKTTVKKHNMVSFIQCEMKEYYKLANINELRNCEAVLHFAWSGVSNNKEQGYEIQINNIQCSCDLLNSAKALGIGKFLYAGSLMEYEHIKTFSEGIYSVSIRNIYHVAKNCARNMLQILANNYGMFFLPVTISNVYGAGEVSQRLINTAIHNMLANKEMGFTSAEQKYDFIYISDAVRAIRCVLEQGKENTDYYIGNRNQCLLKDYIITMRDTLNPSYKLNFGAIPFKGVSLSYNEFNTLSLYTDTDFEPEIDFVKGITKTANWIQENEYD